MNKPITIKEIQTLVAAQLGKSKVKASQRFFADLGAESFDLVNIVAAAEETYHISLDEQHAAQLNTVEDLFKLVQQALETDSSHQ